MIRDMWQESSKAVIINLERNVATHGMKADTLFSNHYVRNKKE